MHIELYSFFWKQTTILLTVILRFFVLKYHDSLTNFIFLKSIPIDSDFIVKIDKIIFLNDDYSLSYIFIFLLIEKFFFLISFNANYKNVPTTCASLMPSTENFDWKLEWFLIIYSFPQGSARQPKPRIVQGGHSIPELHGA